MQQTPRDFLKAGLTYYFKGRFDEEIVAYTKALKLSPQFSEAYSRRADAFRRRGAFSDAIADYTQAIYLEPRVAKNYLERAKVRLETNAMEEAILDLNTAIDLEPLFRLEAQPLFARARSGLKKTPGWKSLAAASEGVAPAQPLPPSRPPVPNSPAPHN